MAKAALASSFEIVSSTQEAKPVFLSNDEESTSSADTEMSDNDEPNTNEAQSDVSSEDEDEVAPSETGNGLAGAMNAVLAQTVNKNQAPILAKRNTKLMREISKAKTMRKVTRSHD